MTKSLVKFFGGQHLDFCGSFVTSEIGFFGLTPRVTLLSHCNLKTLRSKITCFEICVHLSVKNLKLVNLVLLIILKLLFLNIFLVQQCVRKGKNALSCTLLHLGKGFKKTANYPHFVKEGGGVTECG